MGCIDPTIYDAAKVGMTLFNGGILLALIYRWAVNR